MLGGSLAAVLLGGLQSSTAVALPDGRIWERVSSAAKGSADVIPLRSRVRIAEDGSAVQYATLTYFGDARGGGAATDNLAVRSTDGQWSTHGITPFQEPTQFFESIVSGFEPHYVGEFSDDLSQGVFLAKTPLTDAPNVSGIYNLYLRDDLRDSGPGDYRLVTDADIPQADSLEDRLAQYGRAPFIADNTEDFSHVLFESSRLLTVDSIGLAQDVPKLYEWVNGNVRLVGILPDSEGGGPTVAQAGQGAINLVYTTGTLSDDGSKAIFTVPAAVAARDGVIYQRDDSGTTETSDDTTVRVSASERTDCNGDPSCGDDGLPTPTPDPAGPQLATFWAASADASKTFFTTSEQLTDDDINHSNDLYQYEAGASPGSRLTLLSVDREPADDQNGYDVSSVIGASADGDYVYFTVTLGQLVLGGPIGPSGLGGENGERIFVSHNGAIHEVGAINSGTSELSNVAGESWPSAAKWSRVTPDGTHLAFMTQGTAELLSLYGHQPYDHGACPPFSGLLHSACVEIYIYDATANNGSGDLRCASCNPTGTTARSHASFYDTGDNTPGLGSSNSTSHLSHALSDDGRYVFFNSDERLQPDDRNDTTDPYEYDTVSRQVHLLSDGTGTDKSIFLDATPDGRDVVFATRQQLRSTDHDKSRDLYDARIDGASDLGEPGAAVCGEDTCRGEFSPHTLPLTPGSASFNGAGDKAQPASPPAVLALQPLTTRARRAFARRGVSRIVIKVSAPGVITLRIRTRLGGEIRTIKSVKRTVNHGGTLRFQVRLNKAARAKLERTGRLRLTLTAAYSRVALPQTVHMLLQRR